MIKDKVQKALNKQLNDELQASYLYLSMSSHFEAQSLEGFSKWLRLQSQEEYGHAMKIYDFLHQAGANVELKQINTPKAKWKSFLEVFQDVYDSEKKVTASIYGIVDLAMAEKDHAVTNFLQWFVSEQVEEESTALRIIERMKLLGDTKNGIYLLDREMGMRASTS
ncbi:MAG: ferritin [Ignavibacteriales bacterium]|nr:MAG: ferritin [Ignavibacteriales bacterium]